MHNGENCQGLKVPAWATLRVKRPEAAPNLSAGSARFAESGLDGDFQAPATEASC